MTYLISTVESARAEEILPTEILIAGIEAAQHVLSTAEKLKLKADDKLRQALLARLKKNGLGYGIVSRRMGRGIEVLTNYFCNRQGIKPAHLLELIEAVQNPPTAEELTSTKKQSRKYPKAQ